jgi:hypothetical protein
LKRDTRCNGLLSKVKFTSIVNAEQFRKKTVMGGIPETYWKDLYLNPQVSFSGRFNSENLF